MSAHVVIVGGGITGLAAAYRLASDPHARDLGVTCTLVEQEPHLGGKLRTERIDGCLIENGPDSFLSTKPWAAELCRALGLGDRLIGTMPGRAVFVASGGRLHALPEGLMLGVPTRLGPMLRTGLLSPAEKFRMGWDLVLPRRRDNGDESVGGFLRRRLGDAVVTRLAGPLLGGIYAGDADALSLRATFPQLLAWEASHRSLVLAALGRRRHARGGSETAGNGGPGPGSPSPLFLSLVGGLGELVERLEVSLGSTTVLTARTVRRIVRGTDHRAGPGRATPDRPSYTLELDGDRTLVADALLVATPAYVTAGLLASLAPPVATALRAIPYVSTAAVTLAYRRETVGHPLNGHGFVVARDEPLNITACTWVSSKWPHRGPPNVALLRCYLGAAGREAVVDRDDAALVALARSDLRTTMGIEVTPAFTTVTRWMKAMPQYPPGHLDRLEAIEAGMRALPGIALAGAGYRGIGIPDCIRQGTEAAGRLIEWLASPHVRPTGDRAAGQAQGAGSPGPEPGRTLPG